jgi:hypothetical protein
MGRMPLLIRGFCVAILVLALAACGVKPEVNTGGPIHIVAVEMVGDGLPGQLDDLQRKTMALAAALPDQGTPIVLRLQIADYHLKNAAMSLLVGYAHRVTVSVEVLSQDSGTVLSRFQTVTSVDGMINGAIGAVVAATANQGKVMYQLNSKAADDVMEHIYGSKVWKSFRRR